MPAAIQIPAQRGDPLSISQQRRWCPKAGKEYRAAFERELNRLPKSEHDPCLQEVMGRLKNVSTARLLWLIGSHYAYLDNWVVQIVYWLTLGGLFLWALVDISRIPGMVAEYNRRIAFGILHEVVASRLNKETVAPSVPLVKTPNNNPERDTLIDHRAVAPKQSSNARHGLYQAIAFGREHIQLREPEEKDLDAIEQYLLPNETSILIAEAAVAVDP